MLRLVRLMITWLLSPTATRAFLPRISSVHHRSTFVTMSAASTLTGKVCVTVAESLEAQNTAKFLDGSWFLKGRNGREEFERGPRIKGARFFDIDDIASKGDLNPKNLPHMMPPKELFAAAMDAMGVANDDHIIVYGTKGCVSNSLQMKQFSTNSILV
jgi:3-mercaptopyruvate sulfurtransferase SseA